MARPKKTNINEGVAITNFEGTTVDLGTINYGAIEPVNGIGLYTVAIPKDKHERIQKIADFKKISVEKLIDLTLRELIAGRISI
jgi:hypothetical protein